MGNMMMRASRNGMSNPPLLERVVVGHWRIRYPLELRSLGTVPRRRSFLGARGAVRGELAFPRGPPRLVRSRADKLALQAPHLALQVPDPLAELNELPGLPNPAQAEVLHCQASGREQGDQPDEAHEQRDQPPRGPGRGLLDDRLRT